MERSGCRHDYLGCVGPQSMRQQLLKTDPVEKGFLGAEDAAALLLEEKEPLMSSFVVWFELMR